MIVRCYHIYEDIWHAAMNKELDCCSEPLSGVDVFAVTVLRGHQVGFLARAPLGIGRVPTSHK